VAAVPGPSDEQPAGETPEDLSRPAVGGVLWQGLSFLLGKGFTLVATIVLARLLTPSEFGLVALALVFITFAENVSDLGVAQGLVYFSRERQNEDGALLLTALSGAGLFLLGLASAPLIGKLFHEPDVVPMIQVLSGALVLGAVRQVPDALLRRELEFRKRVITEISRAVIQGTVSIALAAAGLGAWAIVWGYVCGSAAWCLSAWLLADYRPRPGFWRIDRAVTRRLLGYGAPAAAQSLLAALIFDVDYLIVGGQLGTHALGTYALAFRLPQLLIINVFFVLSTVAFPLYSRARESPERLKRGYLKGLQLQCAYGVAASAGLFMVAPMLVPVVFGQKWAASVAPLEALAIYAGFRALGAGAVDVYKGIGRPGIAATVSFFRLVVLVPALLIAASGGIDAVAWTQALLALAFAIGMQAVASRVLGLVPADLWEAVRPALAIAAGTAVGAGLVRWLMPGAEELRLTLAVAAGVGLGLLAVWIADADFVRYAKALLWRRNGRTAVAAA
jgi:lipopolysaccharide exporter